MGFRDRPWQKTGVLGRGPSDLVLLLLAIAALVWMFLGPTSFDAFSRSAALVIWIALLITGLAAIGWALWSSAAPSFFSGRLLAGAALILAWACGTTVYGIATGDVRKSSLATKWCALAIACELLVVCGILSVRVLMQAARRRAQIQARRRRPGR